MWYSKEWQSAYDTMEAYDPDDELKEAVRKYEEEQKEKMSYYKYLNLDYDIDEYSLEELKELTERLENENE